MLLTVDAEGSALEGRTLLQKKVFFASRLTGEHLDFFPHYYGPYSSTVADSTDSLVGNRFLAETRDSYPGLTGAFGEIRRYRYEITEDGRLLVDSIKKLPETERWRSALASINAHRISRDVDALSNAAKVMTIMSEAHRRDLSEIAAKAGAYGWVLTQAEVERAMRFLADLGLVPN